MTVWALKGASNQAPNYENILKFLTTSIKQGTARFGWSSSQTADLDNLKNKDWHDMSEEEQEAWGNAYFLLGIAPKDWVVYVNVPHWGACLAGQVSESYSFEKTDNEINDFRHTLKLDPSTVVQFERNDDAVLPVINSRLKLQGRYWRIQYVKEFLETIANINAGNLGKKDDESVGIFYLKKELSSVLKNITEKIQITHPAGKLESLMAEVFRKIPNVINVEENGKHKGWGTDNGADLIVTYNSGLSIINLEKLETLVVQVKSFIGEHWETNAVAQIENAVKTYNAATGLIITTASSTENLEKAVEALSTKLGKSIGLIAGEDVAKFVLKHAGSLIL